MCITSLPPLFEEVIIATKSEVDKWNNVCSIFYLSSSSACLYIEMLGTKKILSCITSQQPFLCTSVVCNAAIYSSKNIALKETPFLVVLKHALLFFCATFMYCEHILTDNSRGVVAGC